VPTARKRALAESPLDGIDRLVETDDLLGVFVELDLVIAGDEPGEADAQQPDQHPPVIQLVEGLPGGAEQDMVGIGIVDGLLSRDRIEIRIAELDGQATRQPVLFAQLETDGLGHPDQLGMQKTQVDGVGVQSPLGGDGLLFAPGDNGGLVETVRFLP